MRKREKMQTEKYNRKSFEVDAVKVTATNMGEVADWCGGTIENPGNDVPFIRVRVNRPINDRQTQAFAGDWILGAGSGFKVYTDKAFVNCFEKVTEPRVVHRDAGSGEFITQDEAEANPETTVSQTV
jgi:hypothetical protein